MIITQKHLESFKCKSKFLDENKNEANEKAKIVVPFGELLKCLQSIVKLMKLMLF